MPIEILMPALSPTMTEGNLVTWLKKEGDTIEAGQVLAEIETDKATMEVEAVDEGILGKIMIPAGSENVPVNAVIALLLEEGESADALQSYAGASAASVSSSSSDVPVQVDSPTQAASPALFEPLSTSSPHPALGTGARIIASPVAKRIASELGVDLTSLQGSGPRGRIVKADVEHAKTATAASKSSSRPSVTAMATEAGYTEVPLSSMRKIIAQRLQESKQTVPHFYLSIECAIDALLDVRTKINATREKEHKISVNDFVVMACSKALHDMPSVNVTFHGNHVRQYDAVDIAVAVAIEGGLVTPIVRSAEHLSLGNLSGAIKELVGKARASKLQPHEFQGGAFCVSNLGMYGVDQFQAIINPPQSCILAVGAGVQKPIVRDGSVSVATLMNCTLSVDHRAVDGALGAEFLKVFKGYIENPMSLLV